MLRDLRTDFARAYSWSLFSYICFSFFFSHYFFLSSVAPIYPYDYFNNFPPPPVRHILDDFMYFPITDSSLGVALSCYILWLEKLMNLQIGVIEAVIMNFSLFLFFPFFFFFFFSSQLVR